MRPLAAPAASEGGFALAEALIALAILAVMLGVTFQTLSTMAHARRTLVDERRAALLAQSLMARVGTDIALAPGSTGGVTGGMSWRIDIDRYQGGAQFANGAQRLLRVDVSILADRGQSAGFALHSLRVAS